MLMTPGLALFYSGLVPERNALNTIKMSFICLSVIPILWAVIEFSLVFNDNTRWIGGLSYVGLRNINHVNSSNQLPQSVFMLFQMMFAIISPAIISGAVVGRMKFSAYFVFIILWSLFVYVPLAHWVWGTDGYLAQLGAIDFAGGMVVHISAGFSALIAALILGPRITTTTNQDKPHSIPLVILGASLLWFGWFGFNAGSAMGANELAIHAAITTMLAASTAVLVWTCLTWIRGARPSTVGAAVAAVVGLVAITPACGYVTPFGAIFIGGISAIITQWVLLFFKRYKKIDDVTDVFCCHGVAGVIGSLLTGIFATIEVNPAGQNGLLHGNFTLFLYQLIGVVIAIFISVLGTALILGVLKQVMNIRTTKEEEIQGIDLVEHGEKAYDHAL
jgi:Amt family ammonium transporter